MKYGTLLDCFGICYDAQITCFVWGHTGLGKSAIANLFAAKRQMGFVDFRLSQIEQADLRGLPDKVAGRTIFLPPDELPIGDLDWADYEKQILACDPSKRPALMKQLQPRLKTGILCLEELPRAPEDVQQAAFQLVYDRAIGKYVLPQGWGIVCTGNFLEGYQQSGFTDPAFLNRFCHLFLRGGETTLAEWTDYMYTLHGEAAMKIIEFTSQNLIHLDGKREGEIGFALQPSRRTWDQVARVERLDGEKRYDPIAKFEVISGLVGMELAKSYEKYSCPIKPQDLLEFGVEALKDDLQKIAQSPNARNQLTGLMWGLLSFLRPKLDEESCASCALDFAFWLVSEPAVKEKDIVVAFCRSLVSNGTGGVNIDNCRAAAVANPKVAELIARARKKAPTAKKRFIDRLNERPELQKLLASVSWGSEE